MAVRGGIILSNRLRAMQEAAENFGESIAGLKEQQRKIKVEEADRAAAANSRAISDRANTASAEAAELSLADFKRRDADALSLRQDQSQLEALDSGLPVFGPNRPADEPVFAMKDPNAGLRNRLLASIETKTTGKYTTAADLEKRTAEAEAAKHRAQEDRALDMRSKTAEALGKELGNKKTKLEIDKLEAQANAAGGPSMAITEENKGVWDKLFSGYRTDSQSTKDSLGQIRKLEALVNGVATGASDIATLYTFIRSFDSPNSAVREAEAQMGQEAAGALNKLLNLRAKYEKGRILPDTVRAEMLQAVQTIKADHESFLGATNARYARLAQAGGLDPSLVVDQEFMAAQGATGGRGAAPGAPAASRPSPTPAAGGEDAAAVAWARQNPDDPRAKKILQLNGAQ